MSGVSAQSPTPAAYPEKTVELSHWGMAYTDIQRMWSLATAVSLLGETFTFGSGMVT